MTIPEPVQPHAGDVNILYLVHDLYDAAVSRRVAMLREGGATVVIAGFRREAPPADAICGCITINLGQTYNGGFLQRAGSVMREALALGRHSQLFSKADVIVARNLEMLALAVRGRRMLNATASPAIVYECLDIHRLLLGRGMVSALLRRCEGWLSKSASALITSSPAFIRHYFNTLSGVKLPILLLENKVCGVGAQDTQMPRRISGPPWKIGWFGVIRCRKSLAQLARLVRQSNGTVEVIIRGRPALDQCQDFHQTIEQTPGMRFAGPYKNPDDLKSIYGEVHFTWAIDRFEEGMNSAWLLPNRLYEGCLYGCVPIAQAEVETGAFITRHGIGVALEEPQDASLSAFFSQLTPERYETLVQSVKRLPASTWACSRQDCIRLVDYLRGLNAKPASAGVAA